MKRYLTGQRADPIAHVRHVFCPVIIARHHQSGDFQPTEFGGNFDKFLHRCQFTAQNIPIIRRVPGFQIDIHTVNMLQQFPCRFCIQAAVGHQNIFQTRFGGLRGGIFDLFDMDCGLGIGISDHLRSDLPRTIHRFPGRDKGTSTGRRHGDSAVLAEGAVHVASGKSDRPDSFTRQKMIERFFFYGIRGFGGQETVSGDSKSFFPPDTDSAVSFLVRL